MLISASVLQLQAILDTYDAHDTTVNSKESLYVKLAQNWLRHLVVVRMP